MTFLNIKPKGMCTCGKATDWVNSPERYDKGIDGIYQCLYCHYFYPPEPAVREPMRANFNERMQNDTTGT